VNDRLLHPHADPRAVQRIFDSYRYGPLGFVAFLLAFASMTASIALDLALAVYFALPGPRDQR
jgi:hypothetical protein